MIIHDVEQNTPEWLQLRIGRPTSSEFHRILTPTGKVSTQADGYMNQLLAEWVLGVPLDTYESEYMRRGHEQEQMAADAYTFETGRETEKVGFITTDDGRYGTSPDRLVVGHPGILEIKNPAPQTQIHYLLAKNIEGNYYPQLQGQLLITDREWVEIIGHCPGFPSVIVRVKRDEPYIEKLTVALDTFCQVLEQNKERLRAEYGIKTEKRPPSTIEYGLDVSDSEIAEIYRRSRQ